MQSVVRARRVLGQLLGWLLVWGSLSGCGVITERVAGWYITRKLDSYLDLESAQKKAARVQVDAALTELRREELSHWVSFLREVRAAVHAGLSEDDIGRLQRHYDGRLDAGVDLLSPFFANVLVGLSAEQLDFFAQRMREDVDEHYEERTLEPDERRRVIEKRALRVVTDLTGDLSDPQTEAMRAILRSVPDERPAQYRAAHANIARFRLAMAGAPTAENIVKLLRAMWDERYDGLGPGRGKTERRAEQRQALYRASHLLDERQRAHVEATLTERIVTLKRFVLAGS
jgi:hypothetical protein